ncbi:MAG: hypothetical protein LUG83_00340 [Lachnospiraceae bacterium]|nr:hypothetical protein [Lachnospiraceae bacterium]
MIRRLLLSTRDSVRETAEKRIKMSRQRLQMSDNDKLWWTGLEKMLCYSGFRRAFPYVTAEVFIALNIAFFSAAFLILCKLFGIAAAFAGVGLGLASETVIFKVKRMRNMNSVNDNLLKFLDFLGSYSITSGEISGILGQIGRYVEEPMKSALEECSYEARTTGDIGAALLSMAEKIEHPQFKEIIRSMEINVRYCADFSMLVSESRRSMRDYLKTSQEKKSMLREAAINMTLLLIMSALSLAVVDGLIKKSVWDILIYSFFGRTAVAITAVIVCLFLRQICEN